MQAMLPKGFPFFQFNFKVKRPCLGCLLLLIVMCVSCSAKYVLYWTLCRVTLTLDYVCFVCKFLSRKFISLFYFYFKRITWLILSRKKLFAIFISFLWIIMIFKSIALYNNISSVFLNYILISFYLLYSFIVSDITLIEV